MSWMEVQDRICVVLPWLLSIGLWTAWWLCGVNWKKAWPVLARGAWAPFLLLFLISAGAWSRLDPRPLPFGAWFEVPNFPWKLVAVGLLASVALLAGWLQGVLGWTPQEVAVEPPPAEHGHGHADHGHEHH
jgi:hypothetical protein